MLKTKSFYRTRCAELLENSGIHADLLMDKLCAGLYLGWYYDMEGARYWLLRGFVDANGKNNLLARAFIGQTAESVNLPIDTLSVMC